MRILIDECLDWRLGRALNGYECISVQKMGWSGIKLRHLRNPMVAELKSVL
jgi:predicted nuclease of predicted toxin-antitoxin system